LKKENKQTQLHFVFGTLATDDLRLQSMKQERSGLWHDQRISPLDPHPGDPISVTIGVGPDISADCVALYYTTDGSTPQGVCGEAQSGVAIAMEKAAVEWDTLLWGYRDRWEGSIPPQPAGTLVRYIIEAWQSVNNDSRYAGRGGAPRVYSFFVDNEITPDWFKDAVMYQIFVDRFAPDPGDAFANPLEGLNGFHGGTLKGITAHLDYLADLGIDALWLTPIFPSPTYHGYDITDYGAIEPRLGSEEDLKELLAKAHQRGIRIILDFVANHISSAHPDFVEAEADPDSDKRDWFFFGDEFANGYDSFFAVKQMPKANTGHPAVRDYFLKHAQYWLELGVDGFRLDHAHGATHAFWSAFRHATRQAKPDSVIFGEVVETPILQRSFAGRMDGCLDFLLFQAMYNFFGFGMMSVSQFNAFLYRHFSFFPEDYAQPSFLDNHDMNRFLWMVEGDKRRLRLASLCLFTLPGPPILYYGTEIGLSQVENVGRMENARLPMPWEDGQDKELLQFYKALIILRKAGGNIWREAHETILIDDARNVYGYRSGGYAVVLNNSETSVEVSLPDWQGASLALATEEGVGWLSEQGQLMLPPFGGVCLRML